VGVLTAFLQNLIGNILNFNTLYTNIVNANNAGKLSDVYFFMGRLTYLIIYFDPIVEASLYNSAPPSFEALDKYFLGQTKKNFEPATVMTILFDLPSTFLNSSIAISSKNSSICLGNLTQFNQSTSLLATQFQLSLYDKMGATLRRIMQSVNPIAFACWYSGFEYFQVLEDYFDTISDVDKLVYNLFHNAGGIYDTTTELVELFRFGDSGDRAYWQKIGNSAGYLLKAISYKPKNFDPYNGKK